LLDFVCGASQAVPVSEVSQNTEWELKRVQIPTPELKQSHDLGQRDFERHPVWIGVHIADQGMPWYELCDEGTYRPWTGGLPVTASGRMLLVSASFQLKNGIRYPGLVSPVADDWDEVLTRRTSDGGIVRIRSISERQGGSPLAILQLHQPHLFLNGERVSFWGGRRGVPINNRQAFYVALGENPKDIFPIRYSTDPKFVAGIGNGQLDGFYRSIVGQPPVPEI
jgi:hypothetical protein